MNSYAPIALFVYKRPEHTRKAIESLLSNKEFLDSPFYIFCDAPRSSLDFDEVIQTRNVVKSFKINNSTVIERVENFGLAKSIISGVTQLCDQYGKVIVVEDDLIVSKNFLSYMNLALSHYEMNEIVMQISGYTPPVDLDLKADALLLPFTTSWGWATWKRSWAYFDVDMKGYNLLFNNKKMVEKFNLDNAYPYTRILKKQYLGEIDSWAIAWYLSVFLREGLILYPRKSLVGNFGFDGTGTHCGRTKHLNLFDTNSDIVLFPDAYLDDKSFDIIKSYYRRENNIFSLFKRFIDRIF